MIDEHVLHDADGLQLVAEVVQVYVKASGVFQDGEDGVLGGEAVLERVVADGGASAGILGPTFFPFRRFALICLSVTIVVYLS